MLLAVFLFVVAGALAGFLSGLLGIGGGVVVVPALIWIFQASGLIPYGQIVHMAAGTSLAAMIITAIFSVRAHAQRGNVDWSITRQFAPWMIPGVIVGASISGLLHTKTLLIILGIILMLVAIRMFFVAKIKAHRTLPPAWVTRTVAFVIGGKSGLLGLGGGILVVPFLTYSGVCVRKAAGTSASCTLPLAIAGTISFILIGHHIHHIPLSSGYVYWPAFLGIALGSVLFVSLGSWLGARLHTTWLKRVFALLLFLVGLHLLI
jgi:uncharacterized protein